MTEFEQLSRNPLNLFADVPGPSPWYLTAELEVSEGFQWQHAGNGGAAAGKTLLVGDSGPVAILGFQNYVKVLGQSTLLIWHQYSGRDLMSSPVHFQIVDLKQLKPFEVGLDTLYKEINSSRKSILLGGSPSVEFDLETTNVDNEQMAEFPAQLDGIDELLLFCNSSAIGISDGWSKANLALMMASPRLSSYQLYPQDWFNNGAFDFGYQWATRVTRNAVTRHIHGEGIRIGSFVLDDSLRNIRLKG